MVMQVQSEIRLKLTSNQIQTKLINQKWFDLIHWFQVIDAHPYEQE